MRPSPLSILCALTSIAPLALAQQGRTSLATLAFDGSPIQGNSGGRQLSDDGRQLLFVTDAANVVPNDTNGVSELFLRDLQTGAIERATPLPGGGQCTHATDGTCTPDARFILFASYGSDFVANDTNGTGDLFVRDRQTGLIDRVSVATSGAQADSYSGGTAISDDGRFVAFETDATTLVSLPPSALGVTHIYVRDRLNGTTVLADQSSTGAVANYFSRYAQISNDGRYVLFRSKASNLLATPMPLYHSQLYLRDLVAGTTVLASASSSGAAPAYDTEFGTLTGDGRFACFANGSPGFDPAWPLPGARLFLRDLASGQTQRVDLDSFGSAPATEGASGGAIDRSGRYVLFCSTSNAFVTRDTNSIQDSFVRDLASGITNRVNVDSTGAQSDEPGWGCGIPEITADGRVVSFWTTEGRFGAGDSNGFNDTYVHERWQAAPTSYCRAKLSSLGCVPQMDSTGAPSATGSAPFLVAAHSVCNQQPATLRYGFAPDRRPFAGGFSCIAPPFVALGGISTGGSPSGSDCSGAPSFDFNAYIRSGSDPRLLPGTVVEAQYLFHDPGDALGQGLTNALQFVIGP